VTDAVRGGNALVTGGASGIGAATARRLAADGWTVTVADVQDDLGRAVAAELGGTFRHLDVSDPGAWPGVLDGVTLVHLNAGVTTGERDFAAVGDEQYRRILSVNVDGVVFGAREAARAMAGTGGAIVATASIAGIWPFAPDPIYTMTKHAVVGLVRSLAAPLGERGITVNAVCPGLVETGLIPPEAAATLRDAGLRLMDPSQVAEAVVAASSSGRSGECWTVLPDRPPTVHTFADVDGL
jgi:NAD(P)-dependent dehydrogenase (short-subunit alcohol dehydrogenase family)